MIDLQLIDLHQADVSAWQRQQMPYDKMIGNNSQAVRDEMRIPLTPTP